MWSTISLSLGDVLQQVTALFFWRQVSLPDRPAQPTRPCSHRVNQRELARDARDARHHASKTLSFRFSAGCAAPPGAALTVWRYFPT